METSTRRVLIVGAGVFGLSTALHLLKRGYSVKIIDSSNVLPARDAASSDINKVVRSSYSDRFYSELACKAIAEWKTPAWKGTYHESGIIVLGGRASAEYVGSSLANDVQIGARVKPLPDGQSIGAEFPASVPLGPLPDQRGYFNLDGGWANATEGIRCAMALVQALGGEINGGQLVTGLTYDNHGQVCGIQLKSGETLSAHIIVFAVGSWTPSLLADHSLGLADRLLATGQCSVTIQLSELEAERYRACPVVLSFERGFYCFPVYLAAIPSLATKIAQQPNKDNIVKLAIHAGGYTNPMPTSLGTLVSTPRTLRTHEDGNAIPVASVKALRDELRELYPELAAKPFSGSRLCWYADTPDGDWIIDFHPKHPSLFFATGGSGHAYKFLPVIGMLAADRIDGVMDQKLVQKFAFDRQFKQPDSSRAHGENSPEALNMEKLNTILDLSL